MKSKSKKRSKRQRISKIPGELILGVLFILLVGIILINKFVDNKSFYKGDDRGTYPAQFASGEKVFSYSPYYNHKNNVEDAGIYSYDGKTKKQTKIVQFKTPVYGTPILSPDNSKIGYYLADTNKEKTLYSLYIYDLKKNKQSEILKNVSLYEGYLQTPVWANDSRSLFITLYDKGNSLYTVDVRGNKRLLGKQYSGNVFKPQVASDTVLVFNTGVPDDYKTALVDIRKDQVTTLSLPIITSFSVGQQKDKDSFIVMALGDLQASPQYDSMDSEERDIVGLYKASLKDQKIQNFSLPAWVDTTNHQRVQAEIMCGEYAVLGQVGIVTREGQGYSEEAYINYFVYNLSDQTLKPLSDKVTFSSNKFAFLCAFDPSQGAIYSQDFQNEDLFKRVNVREIHLAKPDEIKILRYSTLLPYEIMIQQSKFCLNVWLLSAGNKNNHDFAYFQVNQVVYNPECTDEVNPEMIGIYRASLSENSFIKISGSREEASLLPPNL